VAEAVDVPLVAMTLTCCDGVKLAGAV